MQHMTKDILTTKITKATKCSDIFSHKLRALRVLRGQICFFFFGCGFAALGSLWLHYFFFVLFVRFVVKICLSLLTLFWLRLRPVGPFVVVLDFSCLVAALPR
jgi:hypothetical protein